MNNPLPNMLRCKELSFHTTLGIYGALQSVCQQDNKTFIASYELIRHAYKNHRVFISFNDNNQPDGIVLWEENLQVLERVLECNLSEKGPSQGAVVYEVISPFYSSERLLHTWKEQPQINIKECWRLSANRTTLVAI